MKTKPKPHARRMWANYYAEGYGFVCLHGTRTCANEQRADDCSHAAIPVAVIPLDDVAGLVENAMQAYADCPTTAFKDAMTAALTAIGVLPRTKKGRK